MREPRYPAATPADRPFPAHRLQAARAYRPFPAHRHCCPSRSATQSLRTTAPSCPAARSLLAAQFCHCRPSALPPFRPIPAYRPVVPHHSAARFRHIATAFSRIHKTAGFLARLCSFRARRGGFSDFRARFSCFRSRRGGVSDCWARFCGFLSRRSEIWGPQGADWGAAVASLAVYSKKACTWGCRLFLWSE